MISSYFYTSNLTWVNGNMFFLSLLFCLSSSDINRLVDSCEHTVIRALLLMFRYIIEIRILASSCLLYSLRVARCEFIVRLFDVTGDTLRI